MSAGFVLHRRRRSLLALVRRHLPGPPPNCRLAHPPPDSLIDPHRHIWSDAALGDARCSGPCPPGSYCPAGSVLPTACPPGTYGESPRLKDPTCTAPCPEGHYCPANSTSPVPCEGTMAASEGFARRPFCPAGVGAPQATRAGYYATGGVEGARSREAPCESGYRCHLGVRHACAPGTHEPATGVEATRSTRRSAGPALPVTTVRGRRAPRNRAPREPMGMSLATRLDLLPPRARARASAATTARKAPCCRLRVRLERLVTRRGSRRRPARRRASRTRPGNVLRLSVRRGTTAPPVRRTGGNASAARACTVPRGSGAPVQPDEGMVGVAGGGGRAGQADCEVRAPTAHRRAPRRGGSRSASELCKFASVMKHSSACVSWPCIALCARN